MIPANGTGGIHELIGMIQSVQSPEVEPQPRRQPGITNADLGELSVLAFQRQLARDALTANQTVPASSDAELYTAEVVAGANAAAVQRRQRPGSSLGINT
ncbi:hypothetical protein [Pseudomonas sp. M5]|uniref:hypothetical protein n=1 Tax=Pseudomonas sp. M5 TaxID=1620788 RepID=UPI00195DD667|nr:hypothetical protein [Pseudomonas sp. M5]MBM7397251.1 glycosyltransferase A (GT-A) superfamily protein (DUF2064 family) [Pseudomonas sp. M5]HDS1756978.1 hypothetical protein [Pseudomonas putida]